MTKIHIKDLVLDVAEDCPVKDVEAAIAKAVEQVTLDASFVNLVKINFGDAPEAGIKCALDSMIDTFLKLGISNCVLVPLTTKGIQDITIEKLEIDRHE
jgi:hypothetical protein